MSLRYKLLAAVLGITVTVLFLSGAVIVYELIRTHEEFNQFQRDVRSRIINGIKFDPSGIFRDESIFVQHEFIRDVVQVDGEDARGAFTVLKGTRLEERQERIRTLVRRAIQQHRVETEGNEIAIPERRGSARLAPSGYYFYLDIPDLNLHQPLQKVYIVFLVGLVLITVVIYILLSRSVIRPIERLEKAAQRVAAGDYSRPVLPAGRNDEIDTLIEAFNAMMLEVGSYRRNLVSQAEDARKQAKAAEKNLVIAQRLASTGKLASGIAHEVNNPLGGMLNAARRLLREPRPGQAKQDEYVELIIDGLLRIQETVKKILRFTPHQVAPQLVDIDTVLRRAISLASHRIEQEETKLVAEVPAEGAVFGDPFELQQVFLNLLINSLDAVAEKGVPGLIEIHGRVEGRELLISVRDNGIGMSEEQISQAFDFFYTTKDVGEGTGLGLSISHNVIQNHGGRIEIESKEGEGTTMTVVLPLLEADR
jgi:signal transduction histidine kinase